MEQTYQLETTVNSDGTLLLNNLPFKAGDAIEVTIRTHHLTQRRPFGLCAGEFVVPDDFDDPLPEEILRDFEG
jgi:hypothetical protein